MTNPRSFRLRSFLGEGPEFDMLADPYAFGARQRAASSVGLTLLFGIVQQNAVASGSATIAKTTESIGEGPVMDYLRELPPDGAISLIDPPFSAPAGGMALKIYGPGVGQGTAVKIHGVACTSVVSVSPNELTCVTPALAASAGVPYDVEIDRPHGPPIVGVKAFVVTPIQAYYNPTVPGHLWQDTAGTVPANVGDTCRREDDLGPAGNHKLARTMGSGVIVSALDEKTLQYVSTSTLMTSSAITWAPMTIVQFSDELSPSQIASFPTLWTDATTDNSGVYGVVPSNTVVGLDSTLQAGSAVTSKQYGPLPFDGEPHVVAQSEDGTNAGNLLYIDDVLQTPITNTPTDNPGSASYVLATGDPNGHLGVGALQGLIGCELYAGSVLSVAEIAVVAAFFRAQHLSS